MAVSRRISQSEDTMRLFYLRFLRRCTILEKTRTLFAQLSALVQLSSNDTCLLTRQESYVDTMGFWSLPRHFEAQYSCSRHKSWRRNKHVLQTNHNQPLDGEHEASIGWEVALFKSLWLEYGGNPVPCSDINKLFIDWLKPRGQISKSMETEGLESRLKQRKNFLPIHKVFL